jgi:4-alpha-glucanotransferase
MIRAVLGTVCRYALFPMQDLLGLGIDANMNKPGTTEGNWQWRMHPDTLTEGVAKDLLMLTRLYGR